MEENTLPDHPNKERANEFNSFFATIGWKTFQAVGGKVINFTPKSETGLVFHETTPAEIVMILNNLKTKTAVGYDEIPTKILKDLKEEISTSISMLINKSLSTSIFPEALKHAIIRPIYKNKGSANEPKSYRPISILSALSKVFERVASNRIVDYLEKNKKLYASQHAYRKFHSTTTSLVELTEFLYEEIENKRIPAVISTDLSKAFDTVSHDLLLAKLEIMGFHKNTTTWLKSYLKSRSQVTKLGNVSSDVGSVISGVPQGSILGPILFIAFTADFAAALPDCKVVVYADDAAILTSATTLPLLKKKVEDSIHLAQVWYNNNGLLINADKSEVMVMKDKRKLEIEVKNKNSTTTINSVSQLKVLGVTIDSQLTWMPHISKVRARTTNAIRMISRTRSILPLATRRLLVDALVVPHFNYSDILYDGCSAEGSNAIQRQQNFAAKSLLGKRKFDSATEARNKLQWIDLKQRRKVHLGVFFHKAVNGRNSHHSIQMVQQRLATHSHYTRCKRAGHLNSVTHRTAIYEKSVFNRGVKVWNSVPELIKDKETTSFKTTLQRLYKGECNAR